MTAAVTLAAKINAGTVWVNTYLDIDIAMPYGGFKRSGHGRELGDEAVHEFTEQKAVIMAV